MRGIFDDAQAWRLRECVQGIHVDGQAGEMHGMMARVRGVIAASACSSVEIASVEVDVDEHGLRAHPHDHVGGRDRSSWRWRDHLIARADAGSERARSRSASVA